MCFSSSSFRSCSCGSPAVEAERRQATEEANKLLRSIAKRYEQRRDTGRIEYIRIVRYEVVPAEHGGRDRIEIERVSRVER